MTGVTFPAPMSFRDASKPSPRSFEARIVRRWGTNKDARLDRRLPGWKRITFFPTASTNPATSRPRTETWASAAQSERVPREIRYPSADT
jgi:hypothetical protein